MNTPHNDGGPAFHSITVKNGDNFNPPIHTYHRGMSLRDWFAGQALNGCQRPSADGSEYSSAIGIAQAAYELADAMLAARKDPTV